MPTFLDVAFDPEEDTNSTVDTEIFAINATTSGNTHLGIWGIMAHQALTAADWVSIRPTTDDSPILGGNVQRGRGIVEQSAGASSLHTFSYPWIETATTKFNIRRDVDTTGFSDFSNMWLAMWDIEDIKDDTTQVVYVQSTAGADLNDTVFTDLSGAEITVTPNAADEYWLVLAAATYDMGVSDVAGWQLEDGDDNVLLTAQVTGQSGTNNDYSHTLAYLWKAPDTTAKTFTLQGYGGDPTALLNYSVIAIRVASLSSNFSAVGENGGLTNYDVVAAGTDEQITGATVTLTPTSSVTLIAFGINDEAAAGNTMMWKLTDDDLVSTIPATLNATRGAASPGATDEVPLLFAVKDPSPSGATTYDMYVNAAATTQVVKNAFYLAMDNDGGDGGPSAAGSVTYGVRGDVSPAYIAQLASAASVTVTAGSIVGQLNEIAGRTWPDYLEYEEALEAAQTAAGL